MGTELATNKDVDDNPKPPANRRRPVHFVPGEVAVLVSMPRSTSHPLEHDQLYDSVRETLNNHEILACLPLPRDGQNETNEVKERRVELHARRNHADAFVRDTAPSAVWEQVRCEQGLLQRPERLHGKTPRHRPVVVFSTPGDGSRAVLFYRIGVDSNAFTQEEHARLTHDLIHTINTRLRHQVVSAGDTPAQIVAAMPNWMHGATGDSLDGGPASAPRPVPDIVACRSGRWRFDFLDQPELKTLVAESRELARIDPDSTSNVVVAVLDTCPPRSQVVAACNEYNTRRRSNELFLDAVYGPKPISLEAWPSLTPDDFGHLQAFLPNWQGGLEVWDKARDNYESRNWYYNIADHGLFVSGVVKDVAPAADIRVIRVMDDAGIGDLRALLHVLQELPRLVERRDGQPARRLVVNLSLMTDVPTSGNLLPRFFPNTHADADALREHWNDVAELVQLTHRGLAEVIDWLGRQGVLVVAAAGNDGFQPNSRPEERMPARYDYSQDHVIGVASVTKDMVASGFSNRGDHGIAVLGGAADKAQGNNPPQIPDGNGHPLDAVVGMFSNQRLPFAQSAQSPDDEHRNTNGWVYWSGTSFATPIISGLAANIWARDPSLSPGQVRHLIYAFQSQVEPELNTRAIRAIQD